MTLPPLPLSIVGRFYLYALHGFACEVIFTATWEFVVNVNWKFPGNTSLWSFWIYGLSCLVIERMHIRLTAVGIPMAIRALIYTGWTYWWEFTCGYVLSTLDICPWDYTIFEHNFMGLVTLEYFPAWYAGNLIMDYFLLPITMRLYVGPPDYLCTGITYNGWIIHNTDPTNMHNTDPTSSEQEEPPRSKLRELEYKKIS